MTHWPASPRGSEINLKGKKVRQRVVFNWNSVLFNLSLLWEKKSKDVLDPSPEVNCSVVPAKRLKSRKNMKRFLIAQNFPPLFSYFASRP